VEDSIARYCDTNTAGTVAGTSTFAFNNITLSSPSILADKGSKQALRNDVHLRTDYRKIYCLPVAEAHKLPYASASRDVTVRLMGLGDKKVARQPWPMPFAGQPIRSPTCPRVRGFT
jgi:hypothetical protein